MATTRDRQQRKRQEQTRMVGQDEREACRTFVEAELRDWLLLQIRGGAWHSTHKLSESVEARLPGDLAVTRFRLSSRSKGTVATAHKAHGKHLFLNDTIQLLKRQGLVEIRTRKDGDEQVKSTPRIDPRFHLDDEFRNLLTRSADEVARLEAQLLAEGCRDALIVWKEKKLLVDGYTRFDLLSLTGRKYAVREMSFKDRAEVSAFIRQLHYGRRNLSDEMKSYIRGRHMLAVNLPRGGDRAKCNGSTLTVQAIAEQYRKDRKTLFNDRRFAAALDSVAGNCGDEVREMMLSRAIKWTRGDIGRLAKLEVIVQKRTVKKALASGKRPKFSKEGQPNSVLLNLPLYKPEAQAEVLERKLGRENLLALAVVINKKQDGLERNGEPQDGHGLERNGVVSGNGRG